MVVMAAPVVASLLALLRVECAAGLQVCNRVSHALAVLNQQMAHMNAREDLSVPLDDLMVSALSCAPARALLWLAVAGAESGVEGVQASVHLIEAEGGPAMLQLAEQCRVALARAGFNVPPRGYNDKKEEARCALRPPVSVASRSAAALSEPACAVLRWWPARPRRRPRTCRTTLWRTTLTARCTP